MDRLKFGPLPDLGEQFLRFQERQAEMTRAMLAPTITAVNNMESIKQLLEPKVRLQLPFKVLSSQTFDWANRIGTYPTFPLSDSMRRAVEGIANPALWLQIRPKCGRD